MLIVTFLPRVAVTATIHVPADQPTIQAGIDAASDGDIVLVADGIFDKQFNFIGKDIVVRSVTGPEYAIILGWTIAARP